MGGGGGALCAPSPLEAFGVLVRLHFPHMFFNFKPGFHIIAGIARIAEKIGSATLAFPMIAVIAEKKKRQMSLTFFQNLLG